MKNQPRTNPDFQRLESFLTAIRPLTAMIKQLDDFYKEINREQCFNYHSILKQAKKLEKKLKNFKTTMVANCTAEINEQIKKFNN